MDSTQVPLNSIIHKEKVVHKYSDFFFQLQIRIKVIRRKMSEHKIITLSELS